MTLQNTHLGYLVLTYSHKSWGLGIMLPHKVMWMYLQKFGAFVGCPRAGVGWEWAPGCGPVLHPQDLLPPWSSCRTEWAVWWGMWNSSCYADSMIVSGFYLKYREYQGLCRRIFKSVTCHYLCVPPESSLWESVTAVMCVPYTNALHTCRVRDMVITDVRHSIITWENRFLLHLSVSPWNSSFLSCHFHPVPT